MSNMKALSTQFDTGSFSGAVATPTCSSCCCCCCCVATVVGGSIIVAKTIHEEGKRHRVPIKTRRLAVSVAATALTASVAIMLWLLEGASSLFVPIIVGIGVVGLLLLYATHSVEMKNAIRWTLAATVLLAICFAAELYGGVLLLLSGEAGIAMYGVFAFLAILIASKLHYDRYVVKK